MSDVDLGHLVAASPPSIAIAYLAFLLLREALRGAYQAVRLARGNGPHSTLLQHGAETE